MQLSNCWEAGLESRMRIVAWSGQVAGAQRCPMETLAAVSQGGGVQNTAGVWELGVSEAQGRPSPVLLSWFSVLFLSCSLLGRRQVLTLRRPLPPQAEVPGYVVPQEKGEGVPCSRDWGAVRETDDSCLSFAPLSSASTGHCHFLGRTWRVSDIG